MPEHQVIGLRTIDLSGRAARTPSVSRPRENIVTEDEWNFLLGLDTMELFRRHQQGANLISLISNPSILNGIDDVNSKTDWEMVISNLQYQMDAIMSIIKTRKN
jgi:hypothetical protein